MVRESNVNRPKKNFRIVKRLKRKTKKIQKVKSGGVLISKQKPDPIQGMPEKKKRREDKKIQQKIMKKERLKKLKEETKQKIDIEDEEDE